MPVKHEREYRRIDIANLETRDAEDGGMIVEGYATTFGQRYLLYESSDYHVYEQIDARAFDGADLSDVIMQYDHEGRVFARVKNHTLQLTVDDHGLRIRADLSGTDIGRQLYQEIKGGYTDKMSFGFTVARDSREVNEDHETGSVTVIRTIQGFKKIYDVSAVSLPANDATEISARNLSEGVIEEIRQEVAAVKERKRKKQIITIKTKL